jgi:hypothetical protein
MRAEQRTIDRDLLDPDKNGLSMIRYAANAAHVMQHPFTVTLRDDAVAALKDARGLLGERDDPCPKVEKTIAETLDFLTTTKTPEFEEYVQAEEASVAADKALAELSKAIDGNR